MEIINPPQDRKDSERSEQPKPGMPKSVLLPVLFIIGGILFLFRNLNMIDNTLFGMFISWQTLMVVIGIFLLANKNYPGGLVVLFLGSAFWSEKIGMLSSGFMFTFWPIIFVIIGVGILIKRGSKDSEYYHRNKFTTVNENSGGYVDSRNTFGDVKRIVLDPVFNGGYVENGFGATRIDFRKTSLPLGTTVLDVNCYFGSIELYIPGEWNIRNEAHPFLGSSDDKRMDHGSANSDRTLVIKGTVTFGSLEIK